MRRWIVDRECPLTPAPKGVSFRSLRVNPGATGTVTLRKTEDQCAVINPMKIIDEQGNLFGIVNIVDVLVVLLVLAVVTAGVSFLLQS